MKPASEPIEVNMQELEALLERARQGPLGEEDYQKLKAAIHTLGYVVHLLQDQETTIQALRQLLLKPSTEKTAQVLKKAGLEVGEKSRPSGERAHPNPSGHGRNGAEAYGGARRIKVAHASLQPGDHCPECWKGKVYPRKEPALRVLIVGQAPLQATVYELESFRCNLCGEVFEAEAPEEVGEKKYDETSASMIGLLKYGSGVPFNRLAGLEESLGIPLPASTQWGIVQETAELIRPAMEELIRQAAQGEVVYNDDTRMKILGLARASPHPVGAEEEASDSRERTGQFTSGIVSTRQGQRIALFFTGRRHAGENLAQVLARRAPELDPPIQMCDALSRNLPKLTGKLAVIVAHCLAHGRRRFIEVAPNFPEECRHVLETLGEVYGYDAQAEEQSLTPEERLRFHQIHSGPVMEELRAWLNAQFDERKVEPNSGLGTAIAYLLKHWDRLTLFLRQPGAPLDNNICERTLKKAILHRKNSLFYKTENGAGVGDLFMSLIHTCELNESNPFDYLTELQQHAVELAKHPAAWMPWNYRQTLQQADTSQDSA
jgi:transposase